MNLAENVLLMHMNTVCWQKCHVAVHQVTVPTHCFFERSTYRKQGRRVVLRL
jgi:hypothetical protein